jgi:predicted permease
MFRDFRYAWRTLLKNPGFALVAIISLALGIGANSAIFSLVDSLLLRPLPVPYAWQLVAVQSQVRGESLGGLLEYSPLSYPDYIGLKTKANSFSGLTASEYSPFGFTSEKNALPKMKYGVLASGDFFRVLEVRPVLGRSFRPDEDQVVGRDAVVVLSYDFWQTEFGGKRDAIGKTIYLNNVACTVIGVAPESFTAPYPTIRGALYVPLAMGPRLAGDSQANMLERRDLRQVFVHGRLKPGVSVAQAAAETAVIGRQLALAYPETNRTCSLVAGLDVVSRLRENPARIAIVGFLLALAAVVLLIACANVMNLMLSRGRARAREIAVRLAIGAGRGRLIRQLLTESLIIALAGGALGLVVAQAGSQLFSQIRIPSDIPIVLDFGLDTGVLLFTMAVSAASAILFGLVPALQSTKPELARALKAGPSANGKRQRFRGRNALVIAQVAGSLLLLIFATQTYRGASMLLTAPAGFRTAHVLTANFDPSLARDTAAQAEVFYRRLLERAREMPGVKAAALMQSVPLLPGGDQNRLIPEGVQLPLGTEAVMVISNAVSEDYFGVMDIPIVEGRPILATDRADTPRVAVVNELFAKKYYPKQSAVGKRFRMNGAGGSPVQIVGVAKQSKYLFPVEPPLDYMYLPMAQTTQTGTGLARNLVTGMTLALYTVGAPGELAGPVRDLVRSLDSGQPIIGLRTMEEIFDVRARGTLNIMVEALAGLGVLGFVLALVGLYGLMTYSVGLRQREIGIRIAIGADRAGVVKMVLNEGLTLAGAGVAIGVLLWLLASKPVMTLIGARAFSWSLLALVAAGLLGAAALGAYFPARRASQVDPNIVLRQE